MLCYDVVRHSIAAEPRADCELYIDVHYRKHKAQHHHILQDTELMSQNLLQETRTHAWLGVVYPMHNKLALTAATPYAASDCLPDVSGI